MRRTRMMAGAVCGLLLTGIATAQQPSEIKTTGPDALEFSVANMDRSVSPRNDFLRYAAGGWLDRVKQPANLPSFGYFDVMTERVNQQSGALVESLIAPGKAAAPGTPAQQIGTLYKAFVDVKAIDQAGMKPLQGEIDKLAAVGSKRDFARYLGYYSTITGTYPIFDISVFEDVNDHTKAGLYLEGGARLIPIGPIYDSPDGSDIRKVYTDYAAQMLEVAGYDKARAQSIAATSLAIDTMLHHGELDPVKKVDLRNRNNPRTIAQLRAEMPAFDIDAYFAALGLKDPDHLIAMDPAFPATASAVIDKFTLPQLKDYMALRLIQTFSPVLTTKFEPAKVTVNKALLGAYSIPPRDVAAVNFIKTNFGQPLGRLYTEQQFTHAQQARALDMVKRVQAQFRKRMVANDWMSDTTRKAALEKVDKLYYRVGYPDEWVDYSSVRIGGDLVQDLINIHRFEVARGFADLGGPIRHWAFTDPLHTMPTVINAAYNPSINGFEVTAAITQVPAYQPDMDAAVNYCRLGAVIGHEMTHGFDTGGRTFDPSGNMRNWWTDADAKHFDTETQKLVDLGNRFEALPGTFMKGGLTVTENLADIGGITLAFDALNQYLAEHPAENVMIDGLTPQQRCFIAWSQFWAEKRTDEAMRVQLEDNHAPGIYRAVAPLQQVPGFYEAFGIKPGDPMWLAPEKRVHIW
jgi:putative endopeptidase